MKKGIDMPSQPDIMLSTYIWLGIYIFCGVLFLSVASWIIVRGGKDVWEILTEGRGKNKSNG